VKKILSTIIAVLFVLSPLAAFEWGGLVTESVRANAAEVKTNDDLNFKQSNSISLWANLPFGNNTGWYLATQGSYKYVYSFNGFGKNGSLAQVADLDLLKLNGSLKIDDTSLTFALGRYIVMDSTAKVFAQNCDGISVKAARSFYTASLYTGYTGLLNGNNILTINKDGTLDTNQGDFYTKNHPYIPLSLSIDFPSLFLNQAVGFQTNMFFDLGSEKYNRFYLNANVKGPIYGPVYYNLSTCLGTDDFRSLFNYSALSFMVFVGSSTIKLNGEYASGKQLIFKPFRGFNSSVAYGASWSPEYSGVLLPGFDYIFSRREICIEVSGKYVMSYPEDTLIQKGVFGNLKTVTNIYSDLAFEIGMSVYYDLETMGKNNYYQANLGLALSF